MRKTVFLTITIFILCAVAPGLQKETHALDLNVGAMTWFSWWDPVWSSFEPRGVGRDVEFDLPPGFLTGPVLSTKIDETTSISLVFFYWRYETADTLNLGASIYEFERDVHKIESDIVINFRVTDLFKWFIGFKYQGYFYDETRTFISGPVSLSLDESAFFHNMGPGIGAGLTVRLFGPVFLLPNVSAITLFGYESIEHDVQFSYALGGNATLSLAWYIESLNTTIMAGYRYQQLFYLYHGNKQYNEFSSDRIHGVTFSFVVSL